MKHIKIFFILLATSISSSLIAEESNIVEDMFSPVSTYNYQMDPSGKKLLYTKFNGNKYSYLVKSLENDNEIIISEVGTAYVDSSIEAYWIDSDDIIIQFYSERSGINVWVYHLKETSEGFESEEKFLTKKYFVVNSIPQSEDKVILGKRYGDSGLNIFKANVKQKHFLKQLKPKYKLNRGTEDFDKWLFNRNGDTFISFKTEEGVTEVKYKRSRSWRRILISEKDQYLLPVSTNADETILNILVQEGEDIYIKQFHLKEKEFLDYKYKLKSKYVEKALYDRSTGSITAVGYVKNGLLQYEYIKASEGGLFSTISPHMNGNHFHIMDSNAKTNKTLILSIQSDNPGSFFIFDHTSGKLDLLSHSKPSLQSYNFQHSLTIKSTSVDGMQIESYLTPAAHTNGEKSPLIVMPHGGPIGVRDLTYFDEHVQILSQLGYSVLQPNYRGSSGFGKEFLNAGQKQWGRLIEDDILSATNEALKHDFLDPDKVCIFGISYGGYSAIMSVIKYPDAYKCAASYAGVTDLTLLYSEYQPNINEDLKRFYSEYVGDPTTDTRDLIAYSPVYNASEINSPILLAQGGYDSVVDMEHYYRLKYMLDTLDKNYESVFFPEEGHGFSYTKNAKTFFTKLQAFFEKHLN